MKNAIIYILVIVCGCLFLYSQRSIKPSNSPVSVQTAPEREILSIRELQQALNDLGHSRYYCGEVDGKLGGPDSKTRTAWNNYICDRNYKESTYGK
jgi:hypothetical protein